MSKGTSKDHSAAAVMLAVVWSGLQQHVCVLSGRRTAGNQLVKVQHLWLRPVDCDKALVELQRQARAGREAFISACDFSSKRRRKEHACQAHVLWADVDRPPLADHPLPPPTLRVQTSTPERQLWVWRLERPTAAATIERLVRRIAQVLGADPQACDAARCLRSPGSLHTKRQPPTVARLLEHAPERVYPLAAIEAVLPPDVPAAKGPATNGHARVDWAALFAGIPEGARNDQLFRAACRLRADNVPLGLARHLALDWAARCQPPLDPAEATRIVEGVYRRYQPTPALTVNGAGAQRARHHAIGRPWPEPPANAVYRGLAGQFVEAAQPYTEADPLALLAQFLAAFGCAVGPEPHAVVGATRHPARLFLGLVGE
ncbi:MAG TPA: primase alpha helix C-terminal domain-containing protein, partial [Chloroflexota bacterium]|nr:primase alpha helix C-terminal domain-containing protein [Chloroflexota bacterium]